MNKQYERLLFILLIGAWLVGLASTGALAGLSLGSSPNDGTANSVWNISATWQDGNGVWPTLEGWTRTEGVTDFGPTIGTVRAFIPMDDATKTGSTDSWPLTWWPLMPEPDGYVGFAAPAKPDLLPGEKYQANGYVSVQPDPQSLPPDPKGHMIEGDGDGGYDHGLDYIQDEQDAKEVAADPKDPKDPHLGISVAGSKLTEVPAPNANGTLKQGIIQAQVAVDPRPATPAVIVTQYVPQFLVGVWSVDTHSSAKRIKARIRNAAELYPASADGSDPGWPAYNVIEIMEKDGKIPAGTTRLYVCYYAPGTHYVITQQSPLPMPYTVYQVPIADTGADYLMINDGILNLDPNRTGDLNTSTKQAQIPIIGVYRDPALDKAVNPKDANIALNYFDMTDPAPVSPAVRYEAPNAVHPSYGKLYFTKKPSAASLTANTPYYIVVSTNAVGGVYDNADSTGTNYYVKPKVDPADPDDVFGYCSKSGIIRLGTPLDPSGLKIDATIGAIIEGQRVFIDYRKLSSTTFTLGQSGSIGLVNSISALPNDGVWAAKSTDVNVNVRGGKIAIDQKTLPYGTYGAQVNYFANYPTGRVVWYQGNIPMCWDRYSPTEGALFRVAVSAGLNMSNSKQWPWRDLGMNARDKNNKLIFDPRNWPMYYDGSLVTALPGAITTRWLTAVGYGVYNRGLVSYAKNVIDNVTVTVHDSSPAGLINYGGKTSLDRLTCISDANQPSGTDVDPLSIDSADDINISKPDDGSSSSQFVFRIRYRNRDGLQPLPWLHESDDHWNRWGTGSNSGVVLYLDETGTGDYRPHFMRRENPELPSDPTVAGDVYIYRIIPHNGYGYTGNASAVANMFPFAEGPFSSPPTYNGELESMELYRSLACGVYHYFFGCSDDSLAFDNGSFPFENQYPFGMDSKDPASTSGLAEWGETGGIMSSSGLDPSIERKVAGYTEVGRSKWRKFGINGGLFDDTIYVDRPVRAPGMFESGRNYPYPQACELHPKVTCELTMPMTKDDLGRYFDDGAYGWGRFFGTLSPYRSAVNPRMLGAFSLGTDAQRAESSGSYSYETNVFQIMYRQIDNKPPKSITLWVNDANERTGVDDPAHPYHTYRPYAMKLKATETNPNYRAGVWYEYKLQGGTVDLPYGPHTYYFTAEETDFRATWPVRPDVYNYNNGALTIRDWWVPTDNQFSERRLDTYMNNDYAPGPYVNNAPVVSNVSVTKEGKDFVYRATYQDADGQRVYLAKLYIDDDADGGYTMTPDPKYHIDPSVDNTALYKAGVEYVFRTNTLKPGARRFYVKFTDDWGWQNQDTYGRQGEPTRFPAGKDNWISGPVVSGNAPPTLSNGRVESSDLTSNAATLWTFRVTYRDLDNDKPQVKLYIGQLQPPDRTVANPTTSVKTILWDAGHTMLQADGTDVTYSDGADFHYETNLGGPDVPSARRANAAQVNPTTIAPDNSVLADIGSVTGVFVEGDATNSNLYTGTPHAFVAGETTIRLGKALPNPLPGAIYVVYTPIAAKQYYYAFEAYDGTEFASYKMSSGDDTRSDAAGCFLLQDATLKSGQTFKIQPVITRQMSLAAPTNQFDPDPQKIGDIVSVLGVYTTADLGASLVDNKNYYSQTMPDKTVKLTKTLPQGPVWVTVEADTPIVGPLGDTSTITDAQVFQNASSNGKALLISDQKNGFIKEDGSDRAVLLMDGVATFEGKVSATQVAPADPSSIASVEGVYWLDNPDATHRYDNYYEPDHARANGGSFDPPTIAPPVVRVGTTDATAGYATLPNMDEVYRVLGVYDTPALTGTNYFLGAGYPIADGDTDGFKWQEAYALNRTTVWPRNPMDIVSIKGVYLSMDETTHNYLDPAPDKATQYAPEVSELVTLPTANQLPTPAPTKVYIAYYSPGTMDAVTGTPIIEGLDSSQTVYVKIWAKGFNNGDSYVALTNKLPDLTTVASVVTSGTVKPADSAKLADIAQVTGVFVDGGATNYYTGTLNPFKVGDTVVRLGTALPNTAGHTVTINYLPKERIVTVKYADIRYTHLKTGVAADASRASLIGGTPTPWLINGTSFFVSDGVPSNINITGNDDDPITGLPRDVDGGVIGVWTTDPSSPNYFNPRRVNVFGDNPTQLKLSTEVPLGSQSLVARVYQKGDYFIDRWNRELRFEPTHPVAATDRVQVSYFFGQKMPYVLLPNTLPSLSEGNVTQITGSRTAQYIYSVKYTDVDGPNGQKPSFVRVYIDGTPCDMAPATQGTPIYRSGAIYTYTPTNGLSGGSRRFHFEASDGAAVAWFDKNGAHQSEGRLAASDVQDMDGPWVNDPPLLTKGPTNPDPALGAISTTDSVDYTVNLRDLDNDPPFLSSLPAYVAVSGSPRLWVDAGVNDDTAVPMIGTIVGLEPDPLVPTKKRVMVVKVDDGKGNLVDPTWTPDEFAGKLIQISNGEDWSDIFPSPARRIYQIQSNTTNKLMIATDTLEGDRLDPENPQPVPELPADPRTGVKRYAQFRINGLLMTAVGGASNYSLGVDYKITIPGLPVGTHKFHFTGRTLENKPDWLLALASYTNKVPYSGMVRFPSVNDLPGPTVTTVTPGTNVPSVLSGSPTLYRGPKAEYATVQTPTTVKPSNYMPVLSVLGVYQNANFDLHLPQAQQKNFYNPALGDNPPKTDDSVYTTTLAATPDTGDLVQLSSAVDDLLTVTPDVATAINTVSAVYLINDPTLTTAYAAAPALVGGKVKLTKALPAGTTQVYIKYKPATAMFDATAVANSDTVPIPLAKRDIIGYVVGVYQASDTGMLAQLADPATWVPGGSSVGLLGAPIAGGTALKVKYVPWPPAYLKYLAVEPTSINPPVVGTHGIFLAGEALTFRVTYKDINGDPPTYHAGVQGSVKVVFNDTGRTSQMVPVGNSTDYVNGVQFEATLTDVPEGLHPYHFESSDGYVLTRFPVDPANTGANDEKVKVNYKPSLSAGSVDHTSGATTFKYTVTYTDKDNVAPADGGFVQVVLTNHADASKSYSFRMSTVATTGFSAGVIYTVVTPVNADGTSSLPSGSYDAVFCANDGNQNADPLGGTSITVRSTNDAPVIADYTVGKLLASGLLGTDAGKTSDTFVYQAHYRDSDNDPPAYAGSKTPALKLIIDEGTGMEQVVPMTMVAAPLDATGKPLTADYTGTLDPLKTGTKHPETYFWPLWQARVTGKKLGPGNHTYTVSASDGSLESVLAPGLPAHKNGPILMVPFFNLQIVGKDGEPITDRSIVGQEVLIKGKMYFPYVAALPPASISNITIQVTKPDSTAVALNANLTKITPNTVTAPTNWVGDITVTYSGYVDPALLTGQSLTLTASGQWVIGATWPGDTSYDSASTDTNSDGQNDQVRISVTGPSRTVAVADPLNPGTSAPVADMITPPMMIGSTSPGGIFGYDRAVTLRVVRWVPSSGQYFWYDVGGVFPALQPGDAVWIKPTLGSPQIPGTGYPAAEPLGSSYTISAVPTSTSVVPMGTYATHINGVYLTSTKSGGNYYVHSTAAVPFKEADKQIVLTTALPSGTTQVWVDYVGSQSSVDEGWTALDNPAIQRVVVIGKDERYLHTKYRLVKVSAQAYPMQTGASGSPVLDTDTMLPLLKPCSISLTTGWNQFGCIFFNWRTASQKGTPALDSAHKVDPLTVVPTKTDPIGKVLGVYLNAALTGTNYYQPGLLGDATPPYHRGDPTIHLTAALPGSPTEVWIKYELYPREDVGIPMSELHVTHIGVRKTLADAKAAGWLTDYAWRYDAALRSYGDEPIRATASNAKNRVLNAWSGYWIKCYVDCQLEIDPNTKFNGDFTSSASIGVQSKEQLEMPPLAPN